MEKFYKTLLSISLALFVISCSTSKKLIDINNFTKECELSGKIINPNFDSSAISSVLTTDNYLVTVNSSTTDRINIYSVNGEDVIKQASIQIPDCNEYDNVSIFRTNVKNYLCILEVASRNKFYSVTKDYKLEELTHLSGIISKLSIDYSFMHVVGLFDNCIYFLGSDSNNNYCLFKNDIGNGMKSDINNDVSVVQSFSKDKSDNIPFLGSVSFNKKGNKIVFGYNFYNELRFCNLTSGKTCVFSSNIEGFSNDTDLAVTDEDRLDCQKRYYGGCIHVGKKIFIINLDGYIPASEIIPNKTIVEIFSPSNKPFKKLILDSNGFFISVNERKHSLYLISQGDSPKLYIYKY